MPDISRGDALMARTATTAGGQTLALARAVSLAVRVEPGLLRLARRRLFPRADAGVESDLWFSPLVLMRNADALVLDPDALVALRRDLANGIGGEGFASAAHAVVSEAHVDYPDALKLEEELVWEALLTERDPGRRSTMEPRLREAVKAMFTDSDGGRGAAQWAAQASRRMPAAALETDAAGLLAVGASVRLGTAAPAAGLGSLPPALSWLAPAATTPSEPLGVELTGTTLRFVEPAQADRTLDLPPTDPLLAELSWSDGTTTTTTVERLAVGHEVELGRVAGAITLRTLTGRRYTIEPVLAPAEIDAGWQLTESPPGDLPLPSEVWSEQAPSARRPAPPQGARGSMLQRYAKGLEELGPWLPAWPLGVPTHPGDVGRLENSLFLRLASAADAGLSLSPLEEHVAAAELSTGVGTASYRQTSDGVTYRMQFGRDQRPLIVLRDCREQRLTDELALAEQMTRAWTDKRLGPEMDFVVTALLVSGTTLIAVPGGPGAELVFDGSSRESSPEVSLARLAGFRITESRNVGLTLSSPTPTVVALRGLQVRRNRWRTRINVFREPSDEKVKT